MFMTHSGRGARAVFAGLLLSCSFALQAQTLDLVSVTGSSYEPGAVSRYTAEFRSQAGNAVIPAGNTRLEIEFPAGFTSPAFAAPFISERREGPGAGPFPAYGVAAWAVASIPGNMSRVDMGGGDPATIPGSTWYRFDFTQWNNPVVPGDYVVEVRLIDTSTVTVVGSGTAIVTIAFPLSQGVELDAVPGAPVVYAEEIIASPGSPVTLLNPAGDLNLSANLGYSFSIGEVRYARFECDNGLAFAAGSSATYDGAGDASLGAINGLGDSAMHFSITANDNNVTADDRLVIEGERQIVGTDDVSCTYSLYDFPSQAAAGGPAGRVYTVSGPYVRFAASYALEVDAEGNLVADVESNDPAYSEFDGAPPTNDVLLGRIGAFTYGEVQDVTGAVQPLTPAGPAIILADLMDADTALIFGGDFSAASDVFFSPNADCSVNIQSADDFSELEAMFTIGSNATLAHQLCFATDGVAIPVSDYTVALDAVPAAPTVYAVTDLGPLDLGEITRNGTELQAPLAQIPGGWLSRLVLTNRGTQDREYEIAVFGETGNTISTDNLTGIVEGESTLVVDLDTVLTGFTGLPRATLNVTVAAPNNTIQGLYQIVNPDSGSISNHVMVRPGTN